MERLAVRFAHGEDIPRIVEIWKQFFDFHRGFALQVYKESL